MVGVLNNCIIAIQFTVTGQTTSTTVIRCELFSYRYYYKIKNNIF